MERVKTQLGDEFWREAVEIMAHPQSTGLGFDRLAAAVARRFAVDLCAVYLLDRRTDRLVLSGRWAPAEHPPIPTIRLQQGITGMAAYHERAIQVPRMSLDPRSAQGRDRIYQSIIAVPLVEGEALVGAFNLQSRQVRDFAADEVDLLQNAVRPLALTVLKNSQTFDNMQRRTSELQALNELGQAMNAGLELDESLELIVRRAAEVLQAKGAAISLIVEDGTLARATMLSDRPFNWSDEKRIAEYVTATGEPIVIDDLRTDSDPEAVGTSLVCVPLVLEERVVGALTLFDKIAASGTQRRLFSIDDLDMLFALSSQVAAEIEDIRLTGRLQGLVRTQKQQAEELRRLYNRSRALLESISDGLLAVDSQGAVVEANSVARRILGMEALVGRPIGELVEDKPPLSQWVAQERRFNNRVVTLRGDAGQKAAMANLQPVEEARGAVLTFREMGEVGRLVNRVIGVQRTFSFDDIIGTSPAIEKTKELARVASGTRSNILIQGETGTGKEVFAQAIHNDSAFSEGPFLAVNCAALPRDLIESELFGYVEGAFTGASKKGRLGKFELASGGTLFLDEIGEMPPEVQVKLLRVLQEKAIVRVGGDRTIPVDCRVITATNRDLHQAVEDGAFRRDLLYRLDVITILVPPLRERREDIQLFAETFMRNFAERNSKTLEGIQPDVLERLYAYSWPGNVRELENAIEHAVALARGHRIQWSDMPQQLHGGERGPHAAAADAEGDLEYARTAYRQAQRQLYQEALRAAAGDVSRAATLLDMSRATFYRRMRQFDLGRFASKMRFEDQK